MSRAARMAPGFADPVIHSQRTFRTVLTAMAYPGRIVELTDLPAAPAPLGPAAAALCLTLVDHDTPLWLDGGGEGAALDWLRFHCGCPIARSPADARFALSTAAGDAPPLSDLDPGTDEYPDGSATLILQVSRLEAGGRLRLSGPGIPGERRLSVDGLRKGFCEEWRANAALFPSGIDVIFAAGHRVAALPRTIGVTEA